MHLVTQIDDRLRHAAQVAIALCYRSIQWLDQVGLNSQKDLAGLTGLAGPYDFLPIESRTLCKFWHRGPDAIRFVWHADTSICQQPIRIRYGRATKL